MDHKKHYQKLMDRARSREIVGYTERHHVLPRCLGGTDAKENLVRLLPEEHYLAHLLLVKLHPDNHGLVRAAMLMSGRSSPFTRRSNKLYGWLRRKHSAWMKNRVVSRESIEKGASKVRGVPRSSEAKAASAAFHKGRKRPLETGKKISASHKIRCRTPEFRAKMSALKKGRKMSPEACANIGAGKIGLKHSEETKAKMRAAKVGKLKSAETRARMSAAQKLRRADAAQAEANA